jgi:hypothetical protein
VLGIGDIAFDPTAFAQVLIDTAYTIENLALQWEVLM